MSVFQGSEVEPQITWGTNPGQVTSVSQNVPDPNAFADETERKSAASALEYMGLKAGVPLTDVSIDRVFIGSCTNARINDLRAAAEVVKGYKVSDKVYAMIVPGSGQVKREAEAEGLDRVFKEAGFDWREAGCSMCLAMNPDRLARVNVARQHPIETSKAGKAKGGERTWYPQRWRLPLRSKESLLIFAIGSIDSGESLSSHACCGYSKSATIFTLQTNQSHTSI